MNHTKQIIEDAIEGGWQQWTKWQLNGSNIQTWQYARIGRQEYVTVMTVYEALLRPSFWQAVGRTRGWEDVVNHSTECKIFGEYCPEHEYQWMKFIRHLAEGDDYETALSKLT